MKGYVHEVVIACASEVIARHDRSYERAAVVFDPLRYLALLEQKTRGHAANVREGAHMAMPNLDLFSPFDEMLEDRHRATAALDKLNRRYGHHTVYLGAIHGAREESPTRIPFGPPPALEDL